MNQIKPKSQSKSNPSGCIRVIRQTETGWFVKIENRGKAHWYEVRLVPDSIEAVELIRQDGRERGSIYLTDARRGVCSCEAFQFSPADSKTCKHVEAMRAFFAHRLALAGKEK